MKSYQGGIHVQVLWLNVFWSRSDFIIVHYFTNPLLSLALAILFMHNCSTLDQDDQLVCLLWRFKYDKWKRTGCCYDLRLIVLGPVHTNPFSNENGAVLLQMRLSSTLQRRERSPKTEPFENALQSGAIWKRCFLKTLFSSVDGENDAIWKLWLHQNRHDRTPDHSTVSIQNGGQTLPCGFSLDRRYSVDGRKTIRKR